MDVADRVVLPAGCVSVNGSPMAVLPLHGGAPAPTLLLFAMSGTETLTMEPYCRIGRILHESGWNVASLDLPCHGGDRRAGEPEGIAGWAARAAQGEDFTADFRRRVGEAVTHLVATGAADPHRIAAAGTSRGGFLAFHAAAGDPRIRAAAGFAPVTDLGALREFSGQAEDGLVRSLALEALTESLKDRAAWISIGGGDDRVGTDKAISFARALDAANRASNRGGGTSLHVLPIPGHWSPAEWHQEAAAWMRRTVSSTVRILPEEGHPLAVPCAIHPAAGTAGRRPGLVIHLYGRGGSHLAYNMLRPAYAELRRLLQESGYALLVPDLGPEHWMGGRTAETLDALIAAMAGRGEIDPQRVHLLGTSMGASAALVYAMQRPGALRSVCAVFPATDFEAWVKEKPGYLESIARTYGLDPAALGPSLRALSPLHHAADLARTPVYLLHGEADAVVPVHHSRDLAAALGAAGCRFQYREVPGAGHDDALAVSWQEDMFRFIEEA